MHRPRDKIVRSHRTRCLRDAHTGEAREVALTDQSAVPVIVISQSEDRTEAINRHLRNAGFAARCTRVLDAGDLHELLPTADAHLIVVYVDEPKAVLATACRARGEYAPGVPVIAIDTNLDERAVEDALATGAADLVSTKRPNRFKLIAKREIDAFRYRRASNAAVASAREYKQQLRAVVEGSPDAIVYYEDGIIVSANPAWCKLFGTDKPDEFDGLPFLDLFQRESHAALKGALMAAQKGRWEGHSIRAKGLHADGGALPLELEIEQEKRNGKPPAIRICHRSSGQDTGELQAQLTDALNRDPITGLYHRRRFLQLLARRLAQRTKGGVTALVYVKPDQFRMVRDKVGPIQSDQVLLQLADLIRDAAEKHDLYGRFGGLMFTVLLARGTPRDCEAWAEQLRTTIANQVFELEDKSISITCTIGIAIYDTHVDTLETLIDAAQKANYQGRGHGGNRVVIRTDEQDTVELQIEDVGWSERLKVALMHGAFRLLKLPIVSLRGSATRMYDILVRMIDDDGSDVLPGKFMPAAVRQGLSKHVDRWVLAEALQVCATDMGSTVFVRLSEDSLCDETLSGWLTKQIRTSGTNNRSVVLQIAEKTAEKYVNETKRLALELKRAGCGFAIEHFGVGHRPLELLDHIPMDYVKVDGSLMQGITNNEVLQMKVKDFLQKANARGIQTIAERVENANTMAVLFQLGAEFVEGYYIQEAEVTMADDQEAGFNVQS